MATARSARSEPQLDLDLIASQIHDALAGLHSSETEAERNDSLVLRYATAAENARSVAARWRIEIGALLLQARPAWPGRGPGAKGWSEFLARVAIDDATARRYMAEATNPNAQRGGKRETGRVDSILAEIRKLGAQDRKALMSEIRTANVNGGSGESDRGAWITAAKWAARVGPWDLDPFSNDRSHVAADIQCMLEDGGNGLADLATPGSWISGGTSSGVADEQTRVWGQPPYEIVEQAVAHYRHTRFCFLLRLDPSTQWFAALWERTQLLAIPLGDREMFEPPPGVEASSNPQPHAFYYAAAADVTDEIRETCIVLSRYEAHRHLGVVSLTRERNDADAAVLVEVPADRWGQQIGTATSEP